MNITNSAAPSSIAAAHEHVNACLPIALLSASLLCRWIMLTWKHALKVLYLTGCRDDVMQLEAGVLMHIPGVAISKMQPYISCV